MVNRRGVKASDDAVINWWWWYSNERDTGCLMNVPHLNALVGGSGVGFIVSYRVVLHEVRSS